MYIIKKVLTPISENRLVMEIKAWLYDAKKGQSIKVILQNTMHNKVKITISCHGSRMH